MAFADNQMGTPAYNDNSQSRFYYRQLPTPVHFNHRWPQPQLQHYMGTGAYRQGPYNPGRHEVIRGQGKPGLQTRPARHRFPTWRNAARTARFFPYESSRQPTIRNVEQFRTGLVVRQPTVPTLSARRKAPRLTLYIPPREVIELMEPVTPVDPIIVAGYGFYQSTSEKFGMEGKTVTPDNSSWSFSDRKIAPAPAPCSSINYASSNHQHENTEVYFTSNFVNNNTDVYLTSNFVNTNVNNNHNSRKTDDRNNYDDVYYTSSYETVENEEKINYASNCAAAVSNEVYCTSSRCPFSWAM